jgi:hypothetical protein
MDFTVNYDAPNMSQISASREPISNEHSFWTVLALGAFLCDKEYCGFWRSGDHVALIFNEQIKYQSTSSFYKEIVLLHELGHAFGLADELIKGTENIMNNVDTLIEQIENGWISFTIDQIKGIQTHGVPWW